MSAVTDHAPPPPPIPLVPPLHLCRDGCSREILWELNRSPCARTSSTYNRRGIDHFWQRPPVDQWPWPYWQKPSKQNTNEGLLVCLSVHHNCQIYFPKELFIKTFEQRYVSDCSADLLQVLPCCGKRYQQRRLVNNRACIARWAHNAEDICEVHTQMLHWSCWFAIIISCSTRPAIIVRPYSAEDVAIVVTFAVRHGFQVTSYQHNMQIGVVLTAYPIFSL